MPTIAQMLVQIEATTEGLRRELARGDQQLQTFDRNVSRHLQNVDSRFESLGRTLRGLIPAFGALELSRSLIRNIQTLELADARLRRLSDSTDDFNKKQEYLSQTARRLNIDVVTLSDGYAKLLSLQKGGLLKDGQAEALLEGFANVKAALGASDAQIGQVLFGLSQALSSGTVRAEEFNQVTEPLPGLLQEMEKSAGLAAGGLRKLVNDGQVTSDYFGDVLVKTLDSYAGSAENMSGTSVAAFTRLSNAWLDLSRTIGESGLVDVLTTSIGGLAYLIEKVSDLADKTDTLRDKLLKIRRVGDLPLTHVSERFESELKTQMNHLKWFTRDDYRFGGDLADLFSYKNVIPPKIPPKPPKKPHNLSGSSSGSYNSQADAARRAAEAIESVTEALRFENEQMARGEKEKILYNELRKAGVSIDSAAGKKIAALVEQQYALNTAMEASAARMGHIQSLSDSVGDAFSSAFGNAIAQGDSLRDVLQGIAGDIARIVYQESIGNQIKSSVSGLVSQALSGGFSGLFGGGGPFTGATAQLGANHVAASILSILPGKASGGSVSAGNAYLVGEKGPEMFVPNFSGTIVPNGAKGGGATYYIDARGADSAAVARLEKTIIALNGSIERRAVSAVGSQSRRSPGYLR